MMMYSVLSNLNLELRTEYVEIASNIDCMWRFPLHITAPLASEPLAIEHSVSLFLTIRQVSYHEHAEFNGIEDKSILKALDISQRSSVT